LELNGRIYATIAIMPIAVILIGAVAFSHSAEAKKSKKFELKVYVSSIEPIGHKVLLHICMADDDSKCHGEKTVNLQKISNDGDKSRVLAGTFKIKQLTDLGPGDVSACGKLEDHGTVANDCTYGNHAKIGKNKYKEVLNYEDLLNELFK
jgi:hypothetical protein